MMDKLLPPEWLEAVGRLGGLEKINELRVRQNAPVRVLTDRFWQNLSAASGIHIIASPAQIEQILYLACQKSVYAYNEQIVNGFLTINGGVRIGVCGSVIFEKGKVLAIRDVTSLNIRIPHAAEGCSKAVARHILSPPKSTLIIAPPASGKTTFLRDIAATLSKNGLNVLVADERLEIAACSGGQSAFGMSNCDIYSGCNKNYAFSCGIRSMSPDVLICDELGEGDYEALFHITRSGVCVFASIHGAAIRDIKERFACSAPAYFERYVVLSRALGAGTIEGVFDKNFTRIEN